nr:hypothetical protein B0A51_04682 [Rachicladosporium sp. CCFEE 5018]
MSLKRALDHDSSTEPPFDAKRSSFTSMAKATNGHPATTRSHAEDLFADMGAQVANMNSTGVDDELDAKVTDEIESLCMNCHEQGTTRLLLTRIPYFREIVLMSFSCPHCNLRNNEIQSAGEIQPKAAKFAFRVDAVEDLQRQVVKTDTCIFRLEDLDLEIPPGKGRYSNLEGLIGTVREDLAAHQAERMVQMPEVGEKVGKVLEALGEMLEGKRVPFMISVDDPSGNSFIEPRPGDARGKWAKVEYVRTSEQNELLGLGNREADAEGDAQTNGTAAPATDIRPEYHASGLVGGDDTPQAQAGNNIDAPPPDDDIIENNVYSFPATCPGCTHPCATNMKMVSIPYFKQVILMSTVCASCGYRSNEVKTGGEVPEKGQKLTLHVNTAEDLGRDVLKSESAALWCPELQLRVEPGTMGGRFTTVEGILTQIRRDLRAQAFGLEDGDAPDVSTHDSMTSDSKRTWDSFFADLGDAIEGKKPFTMVLEDPLASSYVQSFTAPEPDPQIEVLEYERTEEEEEDLGLRDIRTEGYESDAERERVEREDAKKASVEVDKGEIEAP